MAVVTIVHGRHEHLRGQLRGLAAGTRRPDLHVVVAMGDDGVEDVVRGCAEVDWPIRVLPVGLADGHLPLARARNVGVDEAVANGSGHLVLLDVDCIPDRDLVKRYCDVLAEVSAVGGPPVVACGEVLYLPPLPGGTDTQDPAFLGRAAPHPARPVLRPEELRADPDTTLFWSLSFAVTSADHRAIGGFDEAYVGYGGEDTDFGQRVRRAAGHLVWTGGARARHQHHEVETPPLRHLHDIVRNANLFATRWGWWPMEGWLEEFRARGLVRRAEDGRWLCIDGRLDP